jgi:hypothetical protein
MGRECSTNGEKRTAYRILVGKPEGKRPPGRPRRRWVNNVKIHLRVIGWDGLDRSGSGQGLVEGSCKHGDEPSDSITQVKSVRKQRDRKLFEP